MIKSNNHILCFDKNNLSEKNAVLDYRVYTFLELCNVMNYHKTAENLNMTQPAVTQHIKFLEEYYRCKLFDYSNRKLTKTSKGTELEKYLRNIFSLDLSLKDGLLQKDKLPINIGATKTIGEYSLHNAIASLILQSEYEVNFIIDNTESLLNKLNHFELDLLLLEGYVDKNKYKHTKMSDQEIIGICSINHPFAFKEVSFHEILQQNIVLRENGSGTRSVFEIFLQGQGYGVDSFKNKSVISSNKMIENVTEKNLAISFVYDVIQKQNSNLAYFRIEGNRIMHEFNYVFLDGVKTQRVIELIGKSLR